MEEITGTANCGTKVKESFKFLGRSKVGGIFKKDKFNFFIKNSEWHPYISDLYFSPFL